MQKISTCLWFDNQAGEAAAFYVSLFPNSRIIDIKRYPEGAPRPAGSVLTVQFTLDGAEYVALNGGPRLSPAHFNRWASCSCRRPCSRGASAGSRCRPHSENADDHTSP